MAQKCCSLLAKVAAVILRITQFSAQNHGAPYKNVVSSVNNLKMLSRCERMGKLQVEKRKK